MLRWCDGFEHYGALARATEGVGGGAAWSEIMTGWALSTANPATGSYHLRLVEPGGSDQRIVRRVLGVASQISGFAYRFSVESLPFSDTAGALVLADFRDVSNGSHVMVIMGTDGAVVALRGAVTNQNLVGGTQIGRSDPCIAPGGYHHFEAKLKVDNSTGYLEVRINQVTVLNLTGIDTQNTANASTAQFAFGEAGTASSGGVGYGTFDVDDAFAWDNDATDAENTPVDFIGDKGCYWLAPNADTATAGWAKTASATSYGAIDDIPPNGTDYLSTSDTTERTIVGVASLPANVSEVIAFQGIAYARKEESGGVTLRLGLVSGAEEAYGPDDDPSTEYAYLRPAVKTIDPDTGVPWANDAEPELLIERTA